MANVGSSEFKLSVTLFYLNAVPLATLPEDTQKSPPDERECLPLRQKAGASAPVKATALFLMWPLISSELAGLQHGGLRSVGKSSVKEERGSVYLSLLVGHDSPL